ITSLISNLTTTRINIDTLAATFKEPEDKNVLTEFAHVILWAGDILNNLNGINENTEIEYPGSNSNVDAGNHQNTGTETQPSSYKNIDIKTLRGRLMGDQSGGNDLLGFSVYATAIAELIRLNAKELE